MENFTVINISLAAGQLVLVMLFSPLVNTLMKKGKAIIQGRQGPPLLQGYYDLLKYFRKETIVSEQASWLFTAAPLLIFSITLTTALVVPTFSLHSPFAALGGIILYIYLLGLARFFLVLAAMEPGSGFCGMGSSREMMLALLIEPVMLLSLFVIALMAGSTNLSHMMSWTASHTPALLTPGYLLTIISLLVVSISEIGRVPFDNPETHYELTMIHEGMLLDYSGKPLGLLFWSAWMKQFLVLSVLANLLPPWYWGGLSLGIAPWLVSAALYLIKISLFSLIIIVVESTIAKVRLFQVKEILGASFVLGMLALILTIREVGG